MKRQHNLSKTSQLRKECHILMDDVFGRRNAQRYNWLEKNGYSHHMSEMGYLQLDILKQQLISLDEARSNIYKKVRK